MDVKERRPYCSLTKSRREKERRYTNSSADNEECRVPTQKSYSSSETLKAFDHDSSRLLYGNRVKDLVHREADEYTRQGYDRPDWNSSQNDIENLKANEWSKKNIILSELVRCSHRCLKFRGLPFPVATKLSQLRELCHSVSLSNRGYSISAGSDADTENEAVMSPEHAMRLWGRGVKSGRSSCLSSRSNSALTLTDTEHENKSDSESVVLYNCIATVTSAESNGKRLYRKLYSFPGIPTLLLVVPKHPFPLYESEENSCGLSIIVPGTRTRVTVMDCYVDAEYHTLVLCFYFIDFSPQFDYFLASIPPCVYTPGEAFPLVSVRVYATAAAAASVDEDNL
ncbi:teneurin-3 isoform 2 [Cricetulus griseus]|nr:teneurin-3 isoform 2 [Cricetulus griseus]